MRELRRQGMLVAGVAGFCAFGLLVLIGLDLYSLGRNGWQPETWIVLRSPMVFYFIACVAVAIAGRQTARGKAFGLVLPRMLSLVGVCIASGALWEAFGVAFLLRIFEIGGFRSYAIFNPGFIALGVVGVLLWLVGRLMGRAAAMSRELGEFI